MKKMENPNDRKIFLTEEECMQNLSKYKQKWSCPIWETPKDNKIETYLHKDEI